MKKVFLSSLLCLSTLFLLGQIQLLNDEFNNSQSTSNWQNINVTEGWGIQQLETMDINTTTEGHLRMMPYTATWFGEFKGPLIYKEVTGDFVFTTNVAVQGRTGGLPNGDFNLAGVMCRTPVHYPNGALAEDGSGWQANSQNYIFLAIGNANGGTGGCEIGSPSCPPPQLEVKTTINSGSSLAIQNIDATETQLRFVRIGQTIIILYKLVTSEEWVVHRRYQRNDFPATIQIGLVTYTNWSRANSRGFSFHNTNTLTNEFFPDVTFNPDVIGDYDFARFDRVSVPMVLEDRNFFNGVTDEELLSFLAYDSTPFCPTSLHISDNITSNTFVDVAATDAISMDNSIAPNSVVHISAGNSVTLLSGFEALAGTEFSARIGACTNDNTSLNEVVLQQSLSALNNNSTESNFQLTTQPNPFAVETSIRFAVEKAQLVNLRVYDGNGRKVASILENEWLEQGEHQYTYLPTRGTGSFLYLVLESDQGVVVRKLVMVE